MSKLQTLREQYQTTTDGILKLRETVAKRKDDKGHSGDVITAEERSSFEKLKTERLRLKAEIEAEERSQDVEELIAFENETEQRSRRGPNGRFDPDPDDRIPGSNGETFGDRFGKDRGRMRQHAEQEERRALAMTAFAKQGTGIALTEEERSACHELNFSPRTETLEMDNWGAGAVKKLRSAAGFAVGEERSMRMDRAADRLEERATAGAATRANIVPQVTVRAFEMAMVTYGGLVNAADVMVSNNGGKEAFPSADDTTNEGAQIDEVAAEDVAGADPTWGLVLLGIWEFSSKFARIANSQLRDAPFDIAAAIGSMIALRLVKVIDRKATTGAGTTTLRGLLLDVAAGHEMADHTVFGWQELKRLKYSVDEHYRRDGSFMLHDETLLEYMLLTDDFGRPVLTEPNGDDPGRLLGRPYIINNFFPAPDTVAVNETLVTFGNHKAYKMKFAGQTRIERARERFIEYNQTGFIGFRGADGALQTAGNQVRKLHRGAT